MPVEGDLLERAQEWISREVKRAEKLAEISEVEVSPSDREHRSVSWILNGKDFMAQVVLWESGEFESDFADVATEEVQTKGGLVASLTELERLLESARDWLLQGA
ncbi:hypothetical protein [Streptomyces sp. NPDC091268]|uniref:hypothetical protein n=1 Tax=Streptomyces sp. NPDC091268 TaxID=3365979 RepID=UPI003813D142